MFPTHPKSIPLLTYLSSLQIAWSVETSNFSPYLLSLGISKSLLAIVWIAGPLSGTLVQPYVGIKSDQCRSRFGKRRPFMVGGAAATIVSLLLLAWTREIVTFILHGIFGVDETGQGVKVTTIVIAIFLVYILDFAINVIQAGIRAFIVDNAPTHQQDLANAWASRLTGVGNIVGYLFGYSDLPKHLWFFGNTQFKVLCMIASLAMITTLTISCLTISERDPRQDPLPAGAGGLLAIFRSLYRAVRKLPRQIKAVCLVQFFAWIGWFPFLFYITTYIGEIYVQPIFTAQPDMTPEEVDVVWEQATRIGTLALFVFAITSFAASVILPFFVVNSYKPPEQAAGTTLVESPTNSRPNGHFASPGHGASQSRISRLLPNIPSMTIPWLTLPRAWLLSHLIFAALMWLTFLVHTTTGATLLVALIGIPWATTNWAPFALIAAEISKRNAIRRGKQPPSAADEDADALDDDMEEGEESNQAGMVLGIHNVAIAAPQILATLVSSAIFRALQKPRGSVGDESVAWVLRFGGLAALAAAWFCRKVER